MSNDALISEHYSQADLVTAIAEGFAALGKTTSDLTIDDLSVVDEFHTGGRMATKELMQRLGIDSETRVLDIGCGLGGPARYCAAEFGAQVTGIDLTAAYVEAATALTGWVGLGDKATFHTVSAQDMNFDADSFDVAYLLHVGMNIADKTALFTDVARVLRPGGRLAVYDLMRVGPGELNYPLPWASAAATSHVVGQDDYETGLTAAGFEITSVHDQTELAKAFVKALQSQPKPDADQGPPPVGLHLLMGPTIPAKTANLIAAMNAGTLAPIELIAARPS